MKVKYPTKLSEIPLVNYQKWINTAKNTNDEELLAHKFVQIFLGLELNDVRRMNAKDVNFFIEKVIEVLNHKPKFQKRWKYGHVEFGLIPDLENMSWGEYIDIESNMHQVENWHKAMAVLYRPITETYKDTYNIGAYTGDDLLHEPMKHAPLEVVLGVQVFFYHLEKELLSSTLSSLEHQMKSLKNETTNTAKQPNLTSNGDSITASIKSLKATLQNLTLLQPYHYIKHSHSSATKYKKIESNITELIDN
jgi:hypothetical protein